MPSSSRRDRPILTSPLPLSVGHATPHTVPLPHFDCPGAALLTDRADRVTILAIADLLGLLIVDEGTVASIGEEEVDEIVTTEALAILLPPPDVRPRYVYCFHLLLSHRRFSHLVVRSSRCLPR